MTETFNELAVVGDNVETEYRVIYVLASLPESFSVLVTALEASSDVPKMVNVTERLLHEEQKLKDRGRSGKSKEEALTVKHRRGPQCHYGKRFGHIKLYCREYEKTQSGGHKSRTQRDGATHKVKTVGRSGMDSDSDEVGLVVGETCISSQKGSTDGTWIIDSGATSHICNNRPVCATVSSEEPSRN